MKTIRKIGLIVTLILIIIGCEEIKDPAGRRGVAIVPHISEPNPGIFINGDEDSFVEFVVDYIDGIKPDKTEVVVSNGTNFERLKIAELTSFPSTVNLTFGEVLGALGVEPSSINNGDVLYVEVETTVGGKTYRSNAALGIPVVCEFNPAMTFGNYRAVSAEWAVDGAITITADPDDPYTVYVAGLETIDGLDEDQGPLVMHINPATFKVTADKTVLASLVTWGAPYHNIAYEGSGSFNSCDGKYTMSFSISVDEGDFGAYAFTLTRM